MNIYQITNECNGKRYVGQTKQTLRKRFTQHKCKSRNKSYRHPLYDSIRKYGIENFTISLLEECDYDIRDERETWWVSHLNPEYNLTEGGGGGDTFSMRTSESQDVTRRKLSEHAVKFNAQYREEHRKNTTELWKDPEYRKRVSRGIELANKDPLLRARRSKQMREVALTNRETWSECKKGSKNGRWLGRVEVFDTGGVSVGVYESAVEVYNNLGITAHYVRQKAKSGEPMKSGKYRGYTFGWVN